MSCKLTQRLIAVAAILAVANVGEAAGRFGMPTKIGQYFGHGFGAGHHANLVLGAPVANSQPRKRVKRVVHSPAPPRGYSYGFHAGASTIAEPTQAVSVYKPAPAPQPTRPEPRSPSDAPRPEAIPLPRG